MNLNIKELTTQELTEKLLLFAESKEQEDQIIQELKERGEL